ncbi:ornithine decarboxylase-like [Neosynchiropus ocellatus]
MACESDHMTDVFVEGGGQIRGLLQGRGRAATDLPPFTWREACLVSNLSSSFLKDCLVRDVFQKDHKLIQVLEDGVTPKDFTAAMMKEREATGSQDAFLVGSLDRLRENHRRWQANLPRVTPFFAVKCNPSPVMLRTLSILGSGFDCASQGEIEMALSQGATPDKIIFAHTTKARTHIQYAYSHGVDLMTFDSEDELEKIAVLCPKARMVLRIGVDDTYSIVKLSYKFGAKMSAVPNLLKTAKDLNLNVVGVSFHVGGLCGQSSCFTKAITDSREVFDMAEAMGFKMKLLDLGGGFDGKDNSKMNLEQCAVVINKCLDEQFPPESGVKIIAEPGGFLALSVLTLTSNIIARRVVTDEDDEQLINYYMNEGRFGCFSMLVNHPGYLELHVELNRPVDDNEPRYRSVIWGPTCDSIDKVLDKTMLPAIKVEDWIHFGNMGAYSTALQCEFNGLKCTPVHYVVTPNTIQKLAALLKKASAKSDKCIVLHG